MLDVPLKNFALYWNQARKLDITGKTFSVIFWLIFDSECFWIMQWAWPGAISINRNTSKITKYLYLWREKHLFVFEILFRVFRRSVYWNMSLREKCSVQMRENTDQKKRRIWTFFTQYVSHQWLQMPEAYNIWLKIWKLFLSFLFHFRVDREILGQDTSWWIDKPRVILLTLLTGECQENVMIKIYEK